MPRNPEAEREYGPTWTDACEEMSRVRKGFGDAVRFEVQPSHSIDGRSGVRFSIVCARHGGVLASCGYGRAYTYGAKTMPAAIVHAVIAFERLSDVADACFGCRDDSEAKRPIVQQEMPF